MLEIVPEGTHVVRVALDRSPALEEWERVAAEGHVLVIPSPPLIRVRQIPIPLHLFHHPSRQRYTAVHTYTHQYDQYQSINQSIFHFPSPRSKKKKLTLHFVDSCEESQEIM